MCGIAGIVGQNLEGLNRKSIGSMLSSLGMRGPDEWGTLAFEQCILAHTRLSILDIASGKQPMTDRESGLAITFNGEIYNFQDLRRELSARGHEFATRSDTEVILKAYLEYGVECPRHLDGMFAFAIWDDARETMFLARDRVGKKPLYYAYDALGNFVFASEIKALIGSGLVEGTLDFGAVDTFLRLGYIPPVYSVYSNIHVVKPAESMLLMSRNSGWETRRKIYWRLARQPAQLTYLEAKEEIRTRLADAVCKRMVADVEVGSLLSGGVDSTIVTAYAQRYSTRPIKTFSIGYGDYINELPYSQAAADVIGTEHHTLQVGGSGLADDLLNVTAYFDEPHADSSNVSQFLVSRLAHSMVKVALCGDGGDELFLGYEWYWRHWVKGRAFRLRQALIGSPFRDYINAIQIFRQEERRELWGARPQVQSDFVGREIACARLGDVERINLFDLSVYLPGQLLAKSDRAGMMNSLEVRSPLLDHRLMEFAFNLPLEYKTDRTRGKLILKDLLAEIMPLEFVNRKKQGFGAPVRDWLKTTCRTLLRDLLDVPNARIFAFLDRSVVSQMIERFYTTGDTTEYQQLWVLLCLELWLHTRPTRAAS